MSHRPPSTILPEDDLLGKVEFVIAPEAQAADLMPALARLLLALAADEDRSGKEKRPDGWPPDGGATSTSKNVEPARK